MQADTSRSPTDSTLFSRSVISPAQLLLFSFSQSGRRGAEHGRWATCSVCSAVLQRTDEESLLRHLQGKKHIKSCTTALAASSSSSSPPLSLAPPSSCPLSLLEPRAPVPTGAASPPQQLELTLGGAKHGFILTHRSASPRKQGLQQGQERQQTEEAGASEAAEAGNSSRKQTTQVDAHFSLSAPTPSLSSSAIAHSPASAASAPPTSSLLSPVAARALAGSAGPANSFVTAGCFRAQAEHAGSSAAAHHCAICDVPCHSAGAFEQHVAGVRHRGNEAVFTRGLHAGVAFMERVMASAPPPPVSPVPLLPRSSSPFTPSSPFGSPAYYTQLLEHEFAADIANIHAVSQQHDEGKQWQLFLAAVRSGIDSLVTYESTLQPFAAPAGSAADPDEWNDAGDTFEGYEEEDGFF